MLNYIKILFKSQLTKLSIFILTLIGIILFVLFVFLQKYLHGNNFLIINDQLAWVFKLPIFISSSIFVTIIITNLMSEEDGSLDSIIITKPITRQQIIMSKILVVWGLIIMQSGIWLITSFFATFIDSGSPMIFRIKYSFSIFIGSIIIMLIISSLVIIAIQHFSVKTIMIISSMVSFILPMQTFINNMVIKTHFIDKNKFSTMQWDKDHLSLAEADNFYINDTDDNIIQNDHWLAYKPSLNKAMGVIDLYNQFNVQYSLLYLDKIQDGNIIYEKGQREVINNGWVSLNINNKKYVLILQKNINFHNQKNRERLDKIINNPVMIKEILKYKNKINALSIERQAYLMRQLIAKGTLNLSEKSKVTQSLVEAKGSSATELKHNFTRGLNYEDVYLWKLIESKGITISSTSETNIIKYLSGEIFPSTRLVLDDSIIKTFNEKKIVNYDILIIVWMLIAVLMHTGAILKYKHRQFKLH